MEIAPLSALAICGNKIQFFIGKAPATGELAPDTAAILQKTQLCRSHPAPETDR